jgi:LysR family hydrogen peroxide-inducible transcriptional activator
MELGQLRYLIAVAETGSFTVAAHKLGLSQPSLSLGIKKLEEEIGQPLFDRLTRRVIPTEAGALLIEMARRTFEDIERTTTEIRELRGEVNGVLRVGTIPTIGPFMLPQLIEQFTSEYPEVQISVFETVTDRVLQMLESGDIDVALTSVLPERAGIHVETIAHEELLAIVPANHPLAQKDPVEWRQLEQEKFLVLGGEHCLAEQMARFCRKNKVTGRTVLEGAQLATIAALVERGMGVSLVPALMAQGSYPGCWFGHVSEPRPNRPICLAWSILRYRAKAARAFLDVTRKTVNTMLSQQQHSG